jgi:pilus assembly protein Flp/PilA
MRFLRRIEWFLRSDDGPTAVEYAIILALIVVGCVTAVNSLAIATRDNLDRSSNAIEGALNP